MITERMPRIDINDLLAEVDTWVHFSDHLNMALAVIFAIRTFYAICMLVYWRKRVILVYR